MSFNGEKDGSWVWFEPLLTTDFCEWFELLCTLFYLSELSCTSAPWVWPVRDTSLNVHVVYSASLSGCLLWTHVLFPLLVQVAVCFEHACCLLHLSRWLFALNMRVVYSTCPGGCLLWTCVVSSVLFTPLVQVAVCFEHVCCLLHLSRWLFALNMCVVYVQLFTWMLFTPLVQVAVCFEHMCCLFHFSESVSGCLLWTCMLFTPWTCMLFTPLVQVAVWFEHMCNLLHFLSGFLLWIQLLFTPLVRVAVYFEHMLFTPNTHVVYSACPSGCLLCRVGLFVSWLLCFGFAEVHFEGGCGGVCVRCKHHVMGIVHVSRKYTLMMIVDVWVHSFWGTLMQVAWVFCRSALCVFEGDCVTASILQGTLFSP